MYLFQSRVFHERVAQHFPDTQHVLWHFRNGAEEDFEITAQRAFLQKVVKYHKQASSHQTALPNALPFAMHSAAIG